MCPHFLQRIDAIKETKNTKDKQLFQNKKLITKQEINKKIFDYILSQNEAKAKYITTQLIIG